MPDPRALVTLCLLLLAALAWLADARPPPRIAPADAPRWEGQAVTVSGWVAGVERALEGGQTFRIVADGAAIDARAEVADLRNGDWVEADGRLARFGARLLLLVEHTAATRAPAGTGAHWRDIAAEPLAWDGVPVRLDGTVTGDTLADGNGHEVRLGDGPRPPDGPAAVEGKLRYDPACVCHRLDVAPQWTP